MARQVRRDEVIAATFYGLAQIDEQEGNIKRALVQAEEALTIYERLRDRALNATRELVARLRGKLG